MLCYLIHYGSWTLVDMLADFVTDCQYPYKVTNQSAPLPLKTLLTEQQNGIRGQARTGITWISWGRDSWFTSKILLYLAFFSNKVQESGCWAQISSTAEHHETLLIFLLGGQKTCSSPRCTTGNLELSSWWQMLCLFRNSCLSGKKHHLNTNYCTWNLIPV